ncbi:glutathione binding-like protein [Nannocystis punicea]|uniref:Glutathione S-transferase N-terminal domain-containing protein n=1 Tax=Nannocystis punicea TaxID=2995304 RepID=A0ABY7HBT8_9BACT|nr:glutathione binding-like protein [Nannocystis poenicansa]WAS96732.1 glutathione S-transferase N-terminal domain-containing protein [Nannocystis poenicansa]
MKLYYSPGACSLAPHIALRAAELAFEPVRVDPYRKIAADGRELAALHPGAYVPVLVLDDGAVLTETAVLLQYIADLAPSSGLAPPAGTFARVRVQEWLNFIATELHKGFAPFHPVHPADVDYRRGARARLASRFAYLAARLEGREYLAGDAFTVVDAYAFITLRAWVLNLQERLDGQPDLAAYYARLKRHPAVCAALDLEGVPT